MSCDPQPQNDELLAELSDREQENISAGWFFSGMNQPGFFFFSSQETEIETGSESQVDIAPQGFSSKSKTSYSLSQRSVSFGGFIPFGGGSWGGRMQFFKLALLAAFGRSSYWD
ncbi:MAG: hypothetical protein KME17_21665 [Cyanosarcina radialis HA8281-LM2]|jgi:hypothetical protein|nr:hypothetical protein [Cyanosarcina radialis HA8281-LM2]